MKNTHNSVHTPNAKAFGQETQPHLFGALASSSALAFLAAMTLIFGVSSASLDAAPRKKSMSEENAKANSEETVDRISKEQADAKALVSDLTTTQRSKMLTLLNEGELEELTAIRGVSETRGKAIEKARPFDSIDEVVQVKGIGESTFANLIEHARSLTARRSSSSKKS